MSVVGDVSVHLIAGCQHWDHGSERKEDGERESVAEREGERERKGARERESERERERERERESERQKVCVCVCMWRKNKCAWTRNSQELFALFTKLLSCAYNKFAIFSEKDPRVRCRERKRFTSRC